MIVYEITDEMRAEYIHAECFCAEGRTPHYHTEIVSQKEIDAALYGDSRRSKYGVDLSARGKENRTYENIVYHSRHEMECYRDWIVPQVNVGLLTNLQRQVPFELHVITPGGMKVKVGSYVADWVANDREGNVCIFEAKGRATALYTRSRKHFEAQYGLRIREL